MDPMGKHEAPIAGVIANGHAPSLAPFTIPQLQVRQDAPVMPWPQPGKRQRVTSAARQVAAHRGWLAAIPVVLVNAVAFGAQLGFWRVHVPLVAEAVLVALALETIAIYLAWQAHLAQLADDSALRLRLAAYGMALIIGALNYNHFMLPGWRPTVAAVTFGMMSAISPWLWSVHSRRVSRDALKAKGLIEPHAVRLGGTRWAYHPYRCLCVMSRAAWAGVNDPAKAIALPPLKAAEAPPQVTPEAVPEVTPEPPVQVTPEPVPSQAPEVASSQAEPPVPATPRRKVQVKAGRISDDDLKQDIRELHGVNPAVSVNAAAKQLGRSRDRIRPLLEQVRKETS